MTKYFTELGARLVSRADRFEPRGLPLSIGRCVLALSQLVTLVFTTPSALFHVTDVSPGGLTCGGLRSVSLWCVTSVFDDGLAIGKVLAITVLLVVLSGYRPKITSVMHWYVAFSMATAMPDPDGADYVLQVTTMLMVPLCLGDDRTWQWGSVRRPLPGVWRGAAFAARIALQMQLCAVYLGAVVTKLMDPLWQQGSALLAVAYHPYAGFPRALLELLEPLLRSYWPVALAGWLVIAVQVGITVLIWGRTRARWYAFVLGLGLHTAIAVFMQLAGFGLTMIGVLVVVCLVPGNNDEGELREHDRIHQRRAVRAGSGEPA
ncbi:antimicrobial peptide system SdpB family protein [Lentzea atacamensis]|uniref:Antimicrobial peptide system SdpB family protein n=1 Tax=Lentzea atacamensis TaxID=531938 RepID=A0A316HJN1_9PSEU|nr:hypothetical protein [Lentzea atacamensis]PWK80676.1 antimicrobial peptide system SdpB family protein [Lentzea atacamensis]